MPVFRKVAIRSMNMELTKQYNYVIRQAHILNGQSQPMKRIQVRLAERTGSRSIKEVKKQ